VNVVMNSRSKPVNDDGFLIPTVAQEGGGF